MARDYAAVIAALLAHAEDEANSPEARASYQLKAENMMREYRVSVEEAIAVDPASVVPILKTFKVPLRSYLSRENFTPLIRLITQHCEVLVKFEWKWENNVEILQVNLVGYDIDVRYAEFLWTSTHLMFSTKVDPVWDSSRSEADNIFLLRQAGIERREIADRAWGPRAGDEAKNRTRVQSIYKREAARRGEEATASGLGFNTRLYRESYAQAFWTTLQHRLYTARQAANAAGGVLTLAGRKERIRETFNGFFPPPKFEGERVTVYVSPNENCDRCKKAKSGFCREHDFLKPRDVTKADRERWDREANSPSAQAGRTSGRQAARGVVIQRGTPETGKVNPSAVRALG